MPADVYLSSLDGTVGGDAAGGGSRPPRRHHAAPAIELTGCTKNQPAVATLMSRLRNVHGVTRVSLAKSEKATAAPTPARGGGATVEPVRQGLAARASRWSSSSRAPPWPPRSPSATGEAAAPGAAAAAPRRARRDRQGHRRLGGQGSLHPRATTPGG